MKKFVAVLLAAMLLTMSMGAFAEEAAPAAPAEINWADFEAQITESGWTGEFVTFDEIALQMFMPSVFKAVELTEEEKTEQGYICYFTTEDKSAQIAVNYVDVDGMTLEAYKEYLPTVDATDVEEVIVNGLPAISYTHKVSDTASAATLSFATEMGYIIEFTFAPMEDEGFAAVAVVMMASVQPTAEAETPAA